MADALHPQTLLTWGMNDGDLAGRVRRPAAFARAAPAWLQEPEIHRPPDGNRLHETLRKGLGFGVARVRICLVRGDLMGQPCFTDHRLA